jgi:hypothetical protein
MRQTNISAVEVGNQHQDGHLRHHKFVKLGNGALFDNRIDVDGSVADARVWRVGIGSGFLEGTHLGEYNWMFCVERGFLSMGSMDHVIVVVYDSAFNDSL